MKKAHFLLTTVVLVLFGVSSAFAQSSTCELDWDGNGLVDFDDVLDTAEVEVDGDPIGGFYYEIFIYTHPDYGAYYSFMFPNGDSAKLDWNGDGAIDLNSDTFGAFAPGEMGFYYQWWTYINRPDLYPTFVPGSNCIVFSLIEDFENTVDTWPWGPWISPNPYPLDATTEVAAHDGTYGLGAFTAANPDTFESGGAYYRTDVSFGTAVNEVLSAWCLAGVSSGCGLGFGADDTGFFFLKFKPNGGTISMHDTHLRANPFEWGMDSESKVAQVSVQGGIPGHAWYKMEVHVRANGVFDGQIWAADGVTPIGSVHYNFGTLPATGIALKGGAIDTIEQWMGDGTCIDSDGDGSCNADDLCRGDDNSGNEDGDWLCDDSDMCSGLNFAGDPDGDGICNEAQPDPTVPAFYDQSVSPQGWDAGGVCAERNGASGLPACAQADWQPYVDDINHILATYPVTNAVYDSQSGDGTKFPSDMYRLTCDGFSIDPVNVHMFDDLNADYHATSDIGLTLGQRVNVYFEWGVNIWYLLPIYNARAAMNGGSCRFVNWGLPMGPTGFHASDLGMDPWVEWTVLVVEDCDYYGCRCVARLTVWSDLAGQFTGDSLVYDNQVRNGTGCTDSRFFP